MISITLGSLQDSLLIRQEASGPDAVVGNVLRRGDNGDPVSVSTGIRHEIVYATPDGVIRGFANRGYVPKDGEYPVILFS